MKQLGLGLEEEQPRRPRAVNLEHYHIRSHQTVAEALQGEAKAQAQDEAVVRTFQRYPAGTRMAPSEVWWALGQDGKTGWPLTSVRRAMTNLANAGRLQHHPEDREMGPFGAKESKWSLA